ncbi:MAG TPA: hypothetical protein VFQ76_18905 [Longimicrobiaceae bacterium]|nr:hypothetical protein [Longimicrobiaceae bacterium]
MPGSHLTLVSESSVHVLAGSMPGSLAATLKRAATGLRSAT